MKDTKTFEIDSDLIPTQPSFQEDCKEEIKDEALENDILKAKNLLDSEQIEIPRQSAKRHYQETDSKNCIICYKTIKVQGAIENCKHRFCFTCINRWAKVNFCFNLDTKYLSDMQKKF